ncbi:MAG: VanZ family protein [Bacteroidetes bacterium]|nr:VanZ family protein [Bacteroidota bacterium]
MPNWFKTYRLSLVVALIILILSTIAVKDLPDIRLKNSDKYGHILAYFTFVVVMLWEHARSIRWSTRFGRWSIVLTLIGVIYGVIMEGLQGLFFVYRNFDVADMLANTGGAALGLMLFVLLFPQIKSNMKPM